MLMLYLAHLLYTVCTHSVPLMVSCSCTLTWAGHWSEGTGQGQAFLHFLHKTQWQLSFDQTHRHTTTAGCSCQSAMSIWGKAYFKFQISKTTLINTIAWQWQYTYITVFYMLHIAPSEGYSQSVLERVHIITTRCWSIHDRQQIFRACKGK